MMRMTGPARVTPKTSAGTSMILRFSRGSTVKARVGGEGGGGGGVGVPPAQGGGHAAGNEAHKREAHPAHQERGGPRQQHAPEDVPLHRAPLPPAASLVEPGVEESHPEAVA